MVDAASLQRDLDALVLAGGSREEVVARVGDALGRRVRLVAADGALRVDHHPAARIGSGPRVDVPGYDDPNRFVEDRVPVLHPAELERVVRTGTAVDVVTIEGVRMRAVAVVAAPGRVWALLADAPLDARSEELLVAAVSALRLEAVRRDARADAVAASASWLIDELRFGSVRPTDELTRLATRLGVHLDTPHAAASLYYVGSDAEMWATAISWMDAPVQTRGSRAWSVLSGEVVERASQISRRLVQFARGEVLVGVGAVVCGVEATRSSFEQADRVLALLRYRRRHGTEAGSVAAIDQLGATGLLLSTPRPVLEAFVERQIGPLLDRPELVDTLAAWCRTGGSRSGTAREVTIHRNSVGYRLARIGELLAVDLHHPAVLFELGTAIAARECLGALTTEE